MNIFTLTKNQSINMLLILLLMSITLVVCISQSKINNTLFPCLLSPSPSSTTLAELALIFDLIDVGGFCFLAFCTIFMIEHGVL